MTAITTADYANGPWWTAEQVGQRVNNIPIPLLNRLEMASSLSGPARPGRRWLITESDVQAILHPVDTAVSDSAAALYDLMSEVARIAIKRGQRLQVDDPDNPAKGPIFRLVDEGG